MKQNDKRELQLKIGLGWIFQRMLVDNDKTIMMFAIEVKIFLENIDGSKVTVSAYILLIHLLENSLPHPPWNFSQIQKKFRTLQVLVSNL